MISYLQLIKYMVLRYRCTFRQQRIKYRFAANDSMNGDHEFGMRSGTLATHQIVGIGEASELMYLEGRKDSDSHLRFREILFSSLNQIPDIHINSDLETSIPSIINVSFADVNGETLMSALIMWLFRVVQSVTWELVEPSYVLKGIGLSNIIDSALRFSFWPLHVRRGSSSCRETSCKSSRGIA